MLTNLVNVISRYNGILNDLVWGIPMICLIIGTGIYFSVRTKFFQITHSKEVYEHTIKGIISRGKDKEKGDNNALSQFQALSTALAGTIGTGNIAGVATAIVLGGPGAVFWMWTCSILGMATHLIEIALGLYYRNYDEKTGYSGGPMYYFENGISKEMGLKKIGKVLAIFFTLVTIVATYGMGNMAQINSIAEAINDNFGVPTLAVGIFFAVVTALIIFGGTKRIGQVTEKLVPFMAISYILIGLIVVCLNIKNIPRVFVEIFTSAFSLKAVAGGILGTVIRRAATFGLKRGAFSNEAGMGSSTIAHSASNEKEPVKQGLWGIFEVFFDTIIVCTFTSLIILSSTIKAPSLNETLNNLTYDETIVCINESIKNENGELKLVDNEFYQMPIKIDSSNNAAVYREKPSDGKNYIEIKSYGKTYYVETLEEKDTNDNSYFFGNVLKVKANPLYHTNKEILYDEDGSPIIDSIHIENINGVSLVTLAVSNKLSHIAGKILAIAITLFAFSTVLGWSYYGSKTIEYLFGASSVIIYKVLYIMFIVIGSSISLNLVWDISDTFNGLMALPNLIGVLLLSGKVLQIIKNYYDRKNGKDVVAMTSYK